jgi:cytochrome c oxidase cbb3-type subunit 3/ubiquinol-cytochrome c reductase cytochrome c subunit
MDAPGRPGAGPEIARPDEILDFAALYSQNCAGCHGVDGRNGAAISLSNPVYLAIAGEQNVRQTITKGVRGHTMPAFDKSAGGSLTSQQIDSLVKGMFAKWGRADSVDVASAPPYTAGTPGDPARGQKAFVEFCGSCHGADGSGSKASVPHGVTGSIVDPAYLALISDQNLRSLTIAGRPDLGMPDWRSDKTGSAAPRAMTSEEISDVVAWLASLRTEYPGQPYAERSSR